MKNSSFSERPTIFISILFCLQATSNLVALKKDEVNIISGALEMTQKRVEGIMTKLDDCYMLDIETILNFTVISEIVRTG